MTSILVINGPNLNLLGTRQPEIYGASTLDDIERQCLFRAKIYGAEVVFEQSNHEGVLVDVIHAARGVHDGIVINAGAYSHTSIAIMDALASVSVPTIEVHMSNIYARESFRRASYISEVAVGQICGFGPAGYLMAIEMICKMSIKTKP